MLRAAVQLGYRDVAQMQDVLDWLGLPRPVFYEHFESREDCFLAAFDAAAARLRDRVEAAVSEGGARWRDRLRMGLEELLNWVVAEPDAAQGDDRRGAGGQPGGAAAPRRPPRPLRRLRRLPGAKGLRRGSRRDSRPPAWSAGSTRCSTRASSTAR